MNGFVSCTVSTVGATRRRESIRREVKPRDREPLKVDDIRPRLPHPAKQPEHRQGVIATLDRETECGGQGSNGARLRDAVEGRREMKIAQIAVGWSWSSPMQGYLMTASRQTCS